IFRKLNNKLLNKRSHVVVTHYFSFPFFNSKNSFGDFDFHVLFYLDLTSQSPSFSYFFIAKLWFFSSQNISSTFIDHTFKLCTSSMTTPSGRQKQLVITQRREQRISCTHFHIFFAVNIDNHGPRLY